MSSLKESYTTRFVKITFILTSILIGIGLCIFPLISDDIRFLIPFKNYLNGSSNDWSVGIKTWMSYGDGRITNFISINSSLFPKWIIGIISSICIFLILKLGAILGRFYKSIALDFIYILLFISIFPWVDQLYLNAFQINYIWSTALSLWIIFRILYRNNRFSILTFFLCLLLGFWHEGFCSSILGTIIILFLFSKKYRNLRNLGYSSAITPGLIVLAMYHIPGWNNNYFSTRKEILFIFFIPFLIFSLLWLACFIGSFSQKSKFAISNSAVKAHLLSPYFIAIICLSASGSIFMMLLPTGPRTGSLGIIASCIGICGLLRFYFPKLFNNNSIASKSITIISGAFIFIHLVLVDIQCIKANTSNNYVLREYALNPKSTIYAPITLSINSPFLCLHKPYFDWFAHYPTTYLFTVFYGNKEEPFMVAPKQLEIIDSTKLIKLGYGSDFYLYEDILIGPQVYTKPGTVLLNIHYDDNKTKAYWFYIVPLSDKPGLAWYYPNNSYLFQKEICTKARAIDVW